MTRQDYISIAQAFHRSKPTSTTVDDSAPFATLSDEYRQWNADITAVANVFARNNPRFNREAFYLACEIDGRDNETLAGTLKRAKTLVQSNG